MPTCLHHAVEYDQQLAHTGDECNFPGPASGKQSLVEDPDYRVITSGYQRSHAKRRLHSRPAALYSASASHNSAVSVGGRRSDEGSYPPAAQCARFRQICQEGH